MPPSFPSAKKSAFQLHVEKWSRGCGSESCSSANHVVHARGSIPCHVAFIGEAPGVSEDTIGQPFVGPAGSLLDEIIQRSIGRLCICPHEDCTDKPFHSNHRKGEMTCCPQCGRQQEPRPLTHALFNLVGCLPKDEDSKKREPSVECIMQCAPRLQELLDMARPLLVVCVGTLAKDWLKPGYKNPVTLPSWCKTTNILHPSYILQQNIAQRQFMIQRSVVTITSAAEDIHTEDQE